MYLWSTRLPSSSDVLCAVEDDDEDDDEDIGSDLSDGDDYGNNIDASAVVSKLEDTRQRRHEQSEGACAGASLR